MLVTDYEELGPDEGPKEGSRWTMVFDGASNALGNDIGEVIIFLEGCHTPFTARLCFNCTNNMTEYEVCILDLRDTIDLRIKFLSVFGDSALVISQIKVLECIRGFRLSVYGQDISGPPWKLIVTNILGHVTSARFMQIRCTFLQFL